MTRERRIIGCMSGTSMDGVDAVLVHVHGNGLEMTCRLERLASAPLAESQLLGGMAAGQPFCAADVLRARSGVTESYVQAIRSVGGGERIDLIVCHGQTLYHRPPESWQLFDPWPIVAAFGVPVLSDLRGADLACGGQGAPITPLADWVLFRSESSDRTVVNLGGFVNVTRLPIAAARSPEGVDAGDICPCNHLLDALARERLGTPFDSGGSVAQQGRIDASALAATIGAIRPRSRRSLGTGDEQSSRVLGITASLLREDALATVTAAVAQCVVDAVGAADELVVAGGGARNDRLMFELRERHSGPVVLSDKDGIPVQSREAACMAALGALALDGHAIHLPQVTKAARVLSAGCWSRP